MFKKIDSTSQNSVSSSLAIFDTPPTNVTATSAAFKEILTLNPISVHPFHFRISPGSSFLDLSKCHLVTQMRVRKKADDGTWENLPAGATVAPIQYIGATFIKNMKVSINGREVFHSNGLYAYKAYLDSELSYSNEYKRSYLSAGGWFPCENPEAVTDTGFVSRQELFKESMTVEMISRIHADVFGQDRLIISGVDIDLEITPNDEAQYTIMATDDGTYKLELLSCRLYAKMLNLTEGLNLSIASRLTTQPARYPIRRSELKTETVGSGRRDFHSMLFTEVIPRRIIVGFVEPAAFEGAWKKNPFNFQNFNIRDISINAHGTVYPHVPYDLKWATSSKFARPFHDMHEAVGLRPPDCNGITMNMFKKGWTLFVFNLSTTLDNDDGYDMIRTGTCHIHVKFHTETPAGGVQMIVYGESESMLLIDHTRTVSSDLTI
ncbi:Protein F54H12.2 [Aphelenchoides avenae]|nr:Protein F54H12.2 [Aphelenchus avenae]